MARGRRGGPRERAHLLDHRELGGLPAAARVATTRERRGWRDGGRLERARGRADEDAEARRARRRGRHREEAREKTREVDARARDGERGCEEKPTIASREV